MLQKLPIAFEKVKLGNKSAKLLNDKSFHIFFDKSYILCIEQKKTLKMYITT